MYLYMVHAYIQDFAFQKPNLQKTAATQLLLPRGFQFNRFLSQFLPSSQPHPQVIDSQTHILQRDVYMYPLSS